ncbi:hypothetical protein IFM89_020544 [Coptis chinensis]|uniref:GIR1-like zinc ribbon domain-containing protein n=1 Tax=Coptis chinensis TaxID=261450 RepID=A0A835HFW0_9MAGN|nr:hypothetical protein IFM89_020544 [Coptis chinensis]
MALRDQQHQQQVHVCGGVTSGLGTRNHKPVKVGKGFLTLKSGSICYQKDKQKECNKTMSRKGKRRELDLRLNLSPPRANQENESPRRSPTPPPTSSPSSCVSSEHTDANSPEATSMILVGCPRCLMYVMLAEEDPKCPKCKSTVLLDFLHESNTKKSRKN